MCWEYNIKIYLNYLITKGRIVISSKTYDISNISDVELSKMVVTNKVKEYVRNKFTEVTDESNKKHYLSNDLWDESSRIPIFFNIFCYQNEENLLIFVKQNYCGESNKQINSQDEIDFMKFGILAEKPLEHEITYQDDLINPILIEFEEIYHITLNDYFIRPIGGDFPTIVGVISNICDFIEITNQIKEPIENAMFYYEFKKLNRKLEVDILTYENKLKECVLIIISKYYEFMEYCEDENKKELAQRLHKLVIEKFDVIKNTLGNYTTEIQYLFNIFSRDQVLNNTLKNYILSFELEKQ